jgi:MoaA/NifB/PqqE/SkfB family radical SAM enzyme
MWKQNRSPDGELTTQDWENVLLGLRQWLGKKHIWFTGGESFLRRDCVELIGYGSSLGLSIGVITNGILLNPDQMPAVVEAGLKQYHISIDSMSPEIHDHLRGIKGAHKRATENETKNCQACNVVICVTRRSGITKKEKTAHRK